MTGEREGWQPHLIRQARPHLRGAEDAHKWTRGESLPGTRLTPPSSGAVGRKRKCLRREQVPLLLLTPSAEECPANCRLPRFR